MKHSLLKLVLLLVIGIAGGSKAMADDVTFYRLVPAAMSGSPLAATIDGITWEATVDFNDGKWVFGAKGLTQITSRTPMPQNVTKIVISNTIDYNEYFEINSVKLEVNTSSTFADGDKVDVVTITEITDEMTFTPSAEKQWKNCYFRITYDVKYNPDFYTYKVRFIGADFMMEKNTEMTFPTASYDKELDLIHNPAANTVQVSTPSTNPGGLTPITYSSSNTDIATVNETGLVTLKDGGDVDIIASYAGDADHSPCEAVCTIHSRIPAYLTKEATSMYYVPVGGTFAAPTISLKRQDTDAVVDGTSITYESSEPSIAAVDPATGAVTIGSKVGSVGIRATFTDDGYFTGSTITYTIVVQQPSIVVAETSKECNAEKSYLYIGATQTHISTADVVWYEDNHTTTTTCDWITTRLTDSNLELTVSANSGAERHAVLRIEGTDVLGNSVVSDFITITQKSPVLAWDLKSESFERVGGYNIWGRTLHDPIEMSYPSAYCSQNSSGTTFSPNSSSDKLVITPKPGVTISTITFTATTSDYADALSTFSYTNGDATDDDYKVIVTPSTYGTQPIEISIGSNITLTDISIDYSGNEIYTRSVNPGDFGTIYFEHRAIVEGVKLYQVAGKELDTDGITVTSIVLEEVAGNETVGMVPYVFKATSSELRATLYERNDMGPGSHNGLYGNIDAAEVGRFKGFENLYMFTTTHLQAADASTSSLGANRAYILMELVSVYDPSAGVKGIRLYFDETTGIGLTESTEKTEGTEGIYNLQGQRVNSLQRGINIVGGKKVLVK